jgi:hypothetical protein
LTRSEASIVPPFPPRVGPQVMIGIKKKGAGGGRLSTRRAFVATIGMTTATAATSTPIVIHPSTTLDWSVVRRAARSPAALSFTVLRRHGGRPRDHMFPGHHVLLSVQTKPMQCRNRRLVLSRHMAQRHRPYSSS